MALSAVVKIWRDEYLAAPGFAEAVRLARYIAGGDASAAVHLIDESWQHRVAAVGAPVGRSPASESMCIQVVKSGEPIHTHDATQLARFRGNAFVTGPDPVRLYSSLPVRDEQGRAVGTLCVFDSSARALTDEQRGRLEDVAAQVSHQLRLAELARRLADDALHDSLTRVANRVLLSERLAQALERLRRGRGRPAVALIDLDGFKAVNDELGHPAGDQVLVEFARRLVAAVRAEDTVARLGGDEFVVVLEQLPEETTPEQVRARLAVVFGEPFRLGVREVPARGSIGVVLPEVDELAYEVLGRADAAMYAAKRLARRLHQG